MGFSHTIHPKFIPQKVHISNPTPVNNQWTKLSRIIISHFIIPKKTNFIKGPIINEGQYYLVQTPESCLKERNPFLNCFETCVIVTPFAEDIEIKNHVSNCL